MRWGHCFQINWFYKLGILILTKLTGIIKLDSMNSQLRGSKQKQYEESTQNTYEGSSISK